MYTLKFFTPVLKNNFVVVDGDNNAFYADKNIYIEDLDYTLEKGVYDAPSCLSLSPKRLDREFEERKPMRFEKIESVTVKIKTLEKLLKFTSKDETRPFFLGINFQKSFAQATTGHIFQRIELGLKLKGSYIVPAKELKMLLKMLKFQERTAVELDFSEDFVTINSHVTVHIRLIKRDFPNCDIIIPKKTKHEMVLDNLPKMNDIKPLLNKITKRLDLDCTENNQVILSIPDSELTLIVGTCSQDCPPLSFNADYLYTVILKENSVLKINDSLAPVLVEAENTITLGCGLKR